jgi:hypothetical protein
MKGKIYTFSATKETLTAGKGIKNKLKWEI